VFSDPEAAGCAAEVPTLAIPAAVTRPQREERALVGGCLETVALPCGDSPEAALENKLLRPLVAIAAGLEPDSSPLRLQANPVPALDLILVIVGSWEPGDVALGSFRSKLCLALQEAPVLKDRARL
jgi:hypothetical protein